MSLTLPQARGISYSSKWGQSYADENKAGGALRGSADDLYGRAGSGYEGLANSEGYSPEEKAAITTQGMDTARAGYAGLRDSAMRRASRTGNTAGYFGAVGASDAGEANTLAGQARQNVIDFAKEKQRRQELGLEGEAGLASREGNEAVGYAGLANKLASLQTKGPGSMGSSSWNYMGTYGN